jgi:hypothetical protein
MMALPRPQLGDAIATIFRRSKALKSPANNADKGRSEGPQKVFNISREQCPSQHRINTTRTASQTDDAGLGLG